MDELLIKVNIADRIYPLKINPADEENVRKAAKLINERVKTYMSNFSYNDKQDLLSMCALELATEVIFGDTSKQMATTGVHNTLGEIEMILDRNI